MTRLITTPIYYPNDIPHIGHAYSSIIADIYARAWRENWEEVTLITGTDENSQKIVMKAQEVGMETMAFLNDMALKHQETWKSLDISYTHFIRTTSPEHRAFVQEVLKKTFEAGDIYQADYEGLYCVGCEGFKKPSDLIDGKCPDHPKLQVQTLKEKNYFFRLSKYQKKLEEFYEQCPEFVLPSFRFNEVKEFVRGGLEDFSISRESNTFGIPLPFDPSQVTYVWFDALYSYMSPTNGRVWPADIHVIGKDIVRFHAIYWPAMLMSYFFGSDAVNTPIETIIGKMPKTLLTTGYFTVDGLKMGKSNGNAINPVEWAAKYGRDALVLALLSGIPVGSDGDFSTALAIETYNARLANNLGNLVHRLTVLSEKVDSRLPRNLRAQSVHTRAEHFARGDLKAVLDEIWTLADSANKLLDEWKPWKLDATTEGDEIKKILSSVAENLAVIANIAAPFFPEKMRRLKNILGASEAEFTVAKKGDPLFMRIEVEK